ncbi:MULTISPECIES: tRNA (uridine(54)-C5)-methyltransferase TrmA [Moraxella]|uniref:tRNA/tmRNA (uracil-C(5))-methyltransferase n=1 Tax=Moraxella lacunata TaxID=477 RepID=A0A1B8Q307_MORLA|nr:MULTISPECIES: tRNA (uridine(54)-C5)-methyltransferase TrmA [Moraxella]MBE9579589.1 tRNA (uridine(54)-C5)-methyltransferase TrmA [Moraxella sp. K1664]MBE9588929.1 tRNA (uridine(54)-C5)-methyltransferase TrmA [Moraxella sp. K1630]MBE9591498.1 tRNA (uridine(54)-C5)-methyltransferase TrmA [Moraxella sp. K127]MBE9597415.1 tRNA (uridine(54)-C5)-methyltransferase TrmA [Moraxella sp. K2450]MDH9219698.1 tRNA (uridine(54)-C5)-methyltransferase TrmA [Moraxella lacunata]
MTHTAFTHDEYHAQLSAKIDRIDTQFTPFNPPALEVYESPMSHFRQRAEFRIWHTERDGADDMFYAMFERDGKSKKVIEINDFAIASRAINELMPVLLNELKQHSLLKDKLFQIDFLNTLHGQMLVTLIYHKKLDENWQALANSLADKLNIKLIGRSRGQKLVLSDDFVIEKMSVDIKGQPQDFYYQQIEGGFSQPNAHVCRHMLNFACDVADNISQHDKNDLLELYCGNGNFTLPLSRYFNKVLATEMAKSSVNSAKWAIDYNNISNIAIARLSAQEFSQAHNGEREFRRLAESDIDIKSYDFNTVFVDPPRAGIDDETLKILATFDNIIYISCNPDTLFENLQCLNHTHEIKRFALFDQFPYTHHIESGVWLSKK